MCTMTPRVPAATFDPAAGRGFGSAAQALAMAGGAWTTSTRPSPPGRVGLR